MQSPAGIFCFSRFVGVRVVSGVRVLAELRVSAVLAVSAAAVEVRVVAGIVRGVCTVEYHAVVAGTVRGVRMVVLLHMADVLPMAGILPAVVVADTVPDVRTVALLRMVDVLPVADMLPGVRMVAYRMADMLPASIAPDDRHAAVSSCLTRSGGSRYFL